MRKLEKEEIINRANKVHNKKYDYSLVAYKNLETKVKIICPIHGVFEQTLGSHFRGSGCPECGKDRTSRARRERKDIYGKRDISNTKEFINKAQKIHRGTYDYSLVDYVNAKTKVKIICPIHGVFEQTPNNHLSGSKCAACQREKISNKQKSNTKGFIKKAREIHGNLFDYSLVNYKKAKTKVKIICPIHGVFEQTPDSHLRGRACPKCGIERTISSTKSNTKEFINKAREIHGETYDYSLVKYINNSTSVIIICPEHGEFLLSPKSHLVKKSGCPFCSSSKGEREIQKYLKEKDIPFEFQKTFKNCKYKHVLHFDFYLPDKKICIEYDGIQHSEPVEYFGGERAFKNRKKRDKIKNTFAKESKIKLIRIAYNENIEEVLNENL